VGLAGERREATMIEKVRSRVSEGMSVKSADGVRVGKVVSCQPGGFVVEKGFLSPKDFLVPYERISGFGDGEILLSATRADLLKGAAPSAGEAAREEGRATKESLEAFGTAGEIRVPLVEEEIVTNKRVEKVGEVHVRKEIITEEKQITVPVTREVLRVERVSVNQEVRADDRPFEELSYDIPIREEHITIEKHPVVHEELRVGKEIQRGEETASATVRRERCEVETLGSVRRAEAPGATAEAAAMRAAGSGRR
jgi:uncharacterized protein (TIGR02271 family)